MPVIWIGRWLEFSEVEYFPLVIWSGDRQHKRQAVARPLKIGDSNPVATTLKLHRRDAEIGWVLAVIVDNRDVVQKKSGAIVREQSEYITAGMGNPEAAGVIDGEPFETLCQAGKARAPVARRDVQLIRPNLTHALNRITFEIREYHRVFRNKIDRPAQAAWDNHSRTESC